MAILEIKKYPDPILHKRAKEIKEVTPEIKKLSEDMIQTLLKNEIEGMGLAAPQIGVSQRIMVVKTGEKPVAFINPEIIKKSREKEAMEEGCLSLPGLWLKIKRAKEVEIVALDINGKKIKINAEGLVSRIIQHEIDHLDGVLIINRVNFFRKFKLFHKGGK